MISVMFEQKFLPTDTVVDFGELKYPESFPASGILILFAGLAVLLFCGTGLKAEGKGWRDARVMMIGLLVGVTVLPIGVTLLVAQRNDFQSQIDAHDNQVRLYEKQAREQSEQNHENLFANIESVYDIEHVEIKPPVLDQLTSSREDTARRPLDTPVEAVVLQDGKAYDALLSQNPDTYEPLLSVPTFSHSDAPPIRKK